ncbi:hypothetical protein ABZ297_35790 [Nonomuraea sp. NPDC005983]|uniref:hypothetical protein n=1 Tax=Nonomuraea sp. NPDC005983 TaxID=3155595 RepID=UPI0033AA917E
MPNESNFNHLRRIAALAAATAAAAAALTVSATAASADTDSSALGAALDRVASDDLTYTPPRQFSS